MLGETYLEVILCAARMMLAATSSPLHGCMATWAEVVGVLWLVRREKAPTRECNWNYVMIPARRNVLKHSKNTGSRGIGLEMVAVKGEGTDWQQNHPQGEETRC